jgi:fructose-1,6-bisphosphatase/inositol monophosphatase family enzyme
MSACPGTCARPVRRRSSAPLSPPGFYGSPGFAQLNIWDVAGGATLVSAAGGDVRTKSAQGWDALGRFEVADAEPGRSGLRWRQPIILGEPHAVEMLCQRHS